MQTSFKADQRNREKGKNTSRFDLSCKSDKE